MGDVGREKTEEGWIIFFFFHTVTVSQKALLIEREPEIESEEAVDVEEKMREGGC